MLTVFTDGLYVVFEYLIAITAFFITIFGIGYYSTGIFLSRDIDVKIRWLASLGVGCILLSMVSFIFIALFQLKGLPLRLGSSTILLFAVFILLKGDWLGEFRNMHRLRAYALAILLILLLTARLSFLKHILLPSYSDSPIHYKIVNGFLHPDAGSLSKLSLETIFSNYYHFGFHSLAAWLSSVTEIAPEKSIALLGQLFLVIGPLSVLFLTYFLSKNKYGALLAGLFAAIGWSMPAFAVNWGKFPALMSVALLPGVAALFLLLLDKELFIARDIYWGLILIAGIAFIHTRIVVCLLIFFISLYIVHKLRIKHGFSINQSIRFTLLFLLFLWPLSRNIINFYHNLPVLIAILVLTPFAFQTYPSSSTGVLIFLSGLSLAALIPNLLNIGGQTLLDRQFMALILYIPLSIIGGLGFGGLIKKLKSNIILNNAVIFALVTCVFINLTPRSFYPDRCCNYFKENDKLAFEWIEENSSSHTLYYISTINNDGRVYESDAGMWIFPLTGIPTNKMSFKTDWYSEDIHNKLCPEAGRAVYIYVGGKNNSFNSSQLSRLKWVAPVFQSGEVAIYKISGCTQLRKE